jgi:hypothetical protein
MKYLKNDYKSYFSDSKEIAKLEKNNINTPINKKYF